MRLKLLNIARQMCQRNMSSQSGHTAYIREVQKLQNSGFYPVYVGKIEMNEGLLTGDKSSIANPQKATELYKPLVSIIHAGGALGWVPWNYKLNIHLSGFKEKPDDGIFPELCAELDDHYGNCAIIVNPEVSEESQNKTNGNSLYPTSPVEFLPMICCPEMAKYFGHKIVQTPPEYHVHLNPLNIVWSHVKFFIDNRRKYALGSFDDKNSNKMLYLDELIQAALNKVTQKEWVDAITNELKIC